MKRELNPTGLSAQLPKMLRIMRGDRTLADISQITGISISYLSDIERGRTNPTISTLQRILSVYGVSLELDFSRCSTDDFVMVRRDWLERLKSLIAESA